MNQGSQELVRETSMKERNRTMSNYKDETDAS